MVSWRISARFSALALAVVAHAATFDDTVRPFVHQYCEGCHNTKTAAGGIDLQQPTDLKDRSTWELVVAKLRAEEMPPKRAKQPPEDQIGAVTGFIESEYERQDQSAKPNPGRVTAHRLNRYEYNKTVHDLLGVNLRVADDFPVDPYGYGFDNIGDVLSLSPVLTEKYLKAAERLANAAIPSGPPLHPIAARYLAERMGQENLLHISVVHEFPVDGEYTLRSAWYQALKDGAKLRGKLFLDGRQVSETELSFYYAMDRGFEAPNLHVTQGPHRIDADMVIAPDAKGPKPYLEYIQVYGPNRQTPAEQTSAYRHIFVCSEHTPACARAILAPIAHRAYRRPLTPRELDRLLALVTLAQKRGDTFQAGIRVAIEGILMSPSFLFRVERDATATHPLSDVELASRLSYFLWSSMPDDELLGLAEHGRLHAPGVLKAQVTRMMADPRAHALVENFGGEWLQTRNLDVLKPDPVRFPGFNALLRDDMRTETEMFFASIMKEDRSILDFLDGHFTFLNERLAKHYGIPGVTGDQFRRVELDGTERSGVLTQASVLTVSSYPTRTSPVIRGKWILENLLNTPPPPPPPNVPGARRESRRDYRFRPPAVGSASGQPRLLRLPFAHGSAGLRSGKLRRHRALARTGGQISCRCFRPAAQRQDLPGRSRAKGDSESRQPGVRSRFERQDADLRSRPRPRALRSARDRQDRRQCGSERLPLLKPDSSYCREHAVSNARRRRAGANRMMKSLSRRAMLRGIGTSIALPFLDAMVPAFAGPVRSGSAGPTRLMYVYAPTGMMPSGWYPQQTGAAFDFPRIVKPLEQYREDILFISGLGDNPGRALGDGPGDHARAASSYLTAAHPKRTEGADIHCGISVDQVAARKLGQVTKFGSLELTCEDSRQAGACDSYSCAYQSISWKSETQPLPPEMNPRLLFERLFGDVDTSGTPAERRNKAAYRRSILDLALEDTRSLKGTLGANDRRKLDEYLTSIRELENRIAKSEKDTQHALPPGLAMPAGIPPNYADHARLLFDLTTVAFQTDMTRVATFMMAREGGLRTYAECGVPEAHHSISHHRNDPVLVEKVTKIQCYHLEQFAYFVGRLKATPDGDGSLLDHSAIVYGASMGDPNVHDHGTCPTLVAGKARGRIRSGQHVRYDKETPIANLHLSLLDCAGVPTEKLGDSTGKIDL